MDSPEPAARSCARYEWLPGLPRLFVLLWCGSTPLVAADFGASWTGDFAALVHGGLESGEQNMGLVELTFDHALALGGRDVTLRLSGQHRHGGGFSEEQVGDLQVVSNIDADPGTRLLEAWFEVPLGDHSSLLLGRYDLNSEFDAIEAGGLFLNSSQGIGPDISQTGAAGPSIFPDTAFGIRLQYAGERSGTLRVAALDVDVSAEADGDLPFTGGPMFALEYEWPLQSARVKTGLWRYTRSGVALSSVAADRAAQFGGYASVERKLGQNLVAYARVGAANADVSRIGFYTGGGLVHTGGVLRNRDDAIGFAFGHARNGDGYQDAMRAEGVAVTSGEQAYELTWRVPLTEYAVLQPDVQYIVDPDTNPDRSDALVVMLRVELLL